MPDAVICAVEPVYEESTKWVRTYLPLHISFPQSSPLSYLQPDARYVRDKCVPVIPENENAYAHLEVDTGTCQTFRS